MTGTFSRMPGLFEQIPCRSLDEAASLLGTAAYARRTALERLIARQHNRESEFHLPGICGVDQEAVSFLVDRKWGAQRLDDGTWLPNWRERLECPRCGLNNRQRALAAVVLEDIERRQRTGRCRLWLMEQLGGTHRLLEQRMDPDAFVASEYVGAEHASGTIVGGMRHEDAEQSSFADDSLDVIVSNDVFEHVPRPRRAMAEAARVLAPGGVLYFTIPFHADRYDSVARAELTPDGLEHRLPAEYHGDPFSGGRSLVFTDFGWDVLEMARAGGFADCSAVYYWSLEYGHLGGGNVWFVATR